MTELGLKEVLWHLGQSAVSKKVEGSQLGWVQIHREFLAGTSCHLKVSNTNKNPVSEQPLFLGECADLPPLFCTREPRSMRQPVCRERLLSYREMGLSGNQTKMVSKAGVFSVFWRHGEELHGALSLIKRLLSATSLGSLIKTLFSATSLEEKASLKGNGCLLPLVFQTRQRWPAISLPILR